MIKNPIVTIGMPVFNGEKYIRTALNSLLAQTFTDFELIISDDGSTDKTLQICQEYAVKDKRITVLHNEHRRGGIYNFRIVYEKRQGKYFMWAADHDLWHPEFLQSHVEVLNKEPEVVLVYPLTVAIGADDSVLPLPSPRFDTVGLNKWKRINAACLTMSGAGNMVYGLFRADVIAKCGVYSSFAGPDRLLMLEASIYGMFKQIPRELWFRRYPGRQPNPAGGVPADFEQILDRQRVTLYEDGKAPWYSHSMILVTRSDLSAIFVCSPQAAATLTPALGLIWRVFTYTLIGNL